MPDPSLKVEDNSLSILVDGVRVVAIKPGTRSIEVGDKHISIDDKAVTYTIAVPGFGTYSVSNNGAGKIAIKQLMGYVLVTVLFSTTTGEITEIVGKLDAIRDIVGIKLGTALEASLRPISFNNQVLFNGTFSVRIVFFGKTVYSETKARPLGLHDSVDAMSVLSAGFLDPEENPNINAFLERLKRTKEGDLPGLNVLTREELAALLAILKRGAALKL